ncbi:MAG: helix-turn-helix domain-containing protein [Clostridia bacterium]|nr:helix-turn-helix domain-containing protein [Clostridia bacterium]
MRRLLQERLSEAMRSASMTTEALAQAADVSAAVIEKWLADGRVPSQLDVEKVGRALGVSVPYLMDWDSLYPYREDEEAAVTFPVIGTIRLDADGRIEEDLLDSYETIPQPWLLDSAPDEFFVMQAPGTDLVPAVMPGDLLLCRKAPAVPNGAVAVVLNGAEPVCLRTVLYDETGTEITLGELGPDGGEIHVRGEALAHCHILAHVLRAIRLFQ